MNWREKSNDGLLKVHSIGDYRIRRYVNRLAIWRKDGQRLTWEELQEVKSNIIGDKVAIEVYPRDIDVVNKRHTRHLWFSDSIEEIVNKICRHPEFNNT